MTAVPPASESNAEQSQSSLVIQKILGATGQLLVRQVVVTSAATVATAILARRLDVAEFGAYSAGLAAYYLLLATANFGFPVVLGRRLGAGRSDDGGALRAVIQAQCRWVIFPALVGVGIALAAGVDDSRGLVIFVIIPALLSQGLASARQVYLANYRTASLGIIDIVTNLTQSAVIIALAFAGMSAGVIAAAFSVSVVVNSLLVYGGARRLVDDGRADTGDRRAVLREAMPLGVAAALSSAYFMVDVSLVGFLASAQELGYFAAASKVLSILVMVPSLVMTTALAGLSSQARTEGSLGAVTAHLWHWLAVLLLPTFVYVSAFAEVVVDLLFGSSYTAAASLVRVVALAAAVSLLSNVLSTALIASGRGRWLIMQGLTGLIFSVVGNFALVPVFGVVASAWLKVATELLVVATALWSLRSCGVVGSLFRVSLWPIVGCGTLLLVAGTLRSNVAVAMCVAPLAFALVVISARSWPRDSRVRRELHEGHQ